MLSTPYLSGLVRRFYKPLLCLLAAGMLAACGFHMRGAVDLPFSTVSTNINDNSEFGSLLLRNLRAIAPDTRFVSEKEPADVIFKQIRVQRLSKEMSLDVDGRVEEYELSLIYQFMLTDKEGNILLPPTEIISHELMPYDEDQSDADNQQIDYTYRQMEKGMVDKIVRYISSEQVRNQFIKYRQMDK